MGRAPWTRRPEASVIEEVMAISGCLPLAGRQFAALSGGEQQRVQLARALAQLWCDGAPRGWLFLDEPTSALDLYHQQHLLRLLSSLTRRGICMSVWCCTISIWRRCGRIGSCCYITAKWSLRGPGGGSAGRYADALVRRAGAGWPTPGSCCTSGVSRPLIGLIKSFRVSSRACAALRAACAWMDHPIHFSIGGLSSGIQTAPSDVICASHSAGTALPPSPLATILPTVTS